MMSDFQNDLQMLNVGDYQVTQPVTWDQYQYDPNDSRIFFGLGGLGLGLGLGGCFGCFGCFSCFNCFRCGGCGGCGGCGRCGGCGGCGRCGGWRTK